MAEINTMENLRLWLRTCPAISSTDRFNVDFMEDSTVQYALYSSPTTVDYGTDILGTVYFKPIQELNYIFQALFHYSKDIPQNLENMGFLRMLSTGFINRMSKKTSRKSRRG